MGVVRKTYNAWETAKWICLSYILSCVVGGLFHSTIKGKIDDANRAAMFILLGSVLAFIIILSTVGIRRWKKGQLEAFEKRFIVFSFAMYPGMFALGWFTDIF